MYIIYIYTAFILYIEVFPLERICGWTSFRLIIKIPCITFWKIFMNSQYCDFFYIDPNTRNNTMYYYIPSYRIYESKIYVNASSNEMYKNKNLFYKLSNFQPVLFINIYKLNEDWEIFSLPHEQSNLEDNKKLNVVLPSSAIYWALVLGVASPICSQPTNAMKLPVELTFHCIVKVQ